jgi:hypothetical protein
MNAFSHHTSAPLSAIDTEIDGLVVAMGATLLVASPDPADRVATMLHLHRQGFRAADVSRLAERAIDKARELRDVFGLDSLGEALGAIGLAAIWASIVALACMFDPGEAQAHAIAAAPATAPEQGAPIWLLIMMFVFVAVVIERTVTAILVERGLAQLIEEEIERLRAQDDGMRPHAALTHAAPETDADADYANITAERQAMLAAGDGASRYDDILTAARTRKLEAEADMRHASLARSKAIGGAR